jgi:hypothetical protein
MTFRLIPTKYERIAERVRYCLTDNQRPLSAIERAFLVVLACATAGAWIGWLLERHQ